MSTVFYCLLTFLVSFPTAWVLRGQVMKVEAEHKALVSVGGWWGKSQLVRDAGVCDVAEEEEART